MPSDSALQGNPAVVWRHGAWRSNVESERSSEASLCGLLLSACVTHQVAKQTGIMGMNRSARVRVLQTGDEKLRPRTAPEHDGTERIHRGS